MENGATPDTPNAIDPRGSIVHRLDATGRVVAVWNLTKQEYYDVMYGPEPDDLPQTPPPSPPMTPIEEQAYADSVARATAWLKGRMNDAP